MRNQDNLIFQQCSNEDLIMVNELAELIWPSAFKDILTSEQIRYMLDWMYNPDKLLQQLKEGHFFFIVKNENTNIGFVGVEPNYPEKGKLRIHKIYLSPDFQGKMIGKWMLEQTEQFARKHNLDYLHLNVNRYNPAVDFYKKGGFKTIKTEDLDIGNGYFMNDFVMEKKL